MPRFIIEELMTADFSRIWLTIHVTERKNCDL